MSAFFSLYMERTRNSTLITEEDFVASTTYTSMEYAHRILSSICLVLIYTMVSYVLWKSRGVNRTPRQARIFRILLVLFTLVLTNSSIIFALGIVRFSPDSWAWCSAIGTIPATVYTLGHACNYLIFIQRSEILDGHEPKIVKYIRNIGKLGAYSTIIFGVSVITIIRGKLLPTYICVGDYPWWGSVIVLVSDLSLSVTFLLLFYIPVRVHARSLQTNCTTPESTLKLMEVARKNLKWSSITIGTTFVYLLAVCSIRFVTTLSTGYSIDRYTAYFLDWCFAPIDLVINTFSVLQITGVVWKPKVRNVASVVASRRTASSENRKTASVVPASASG